MDELKCTKCGIAITEKDVMVEAGYTTKLCPNCRAANNLFIFVLIILVLVIMFFAFK